MSFQVFDKDDADSWKLIRIEQVVTLKRLSISGWIIWKWFSSRKEWTDAYGILLDSHRTWSHRQPFLGPDSYYCSRGG
jgi:hypothetical protein